MAIPDRSIEQRRRKQRLGTGAFFAACLIAVGIMLTAKTADTRFGIAAGVLGALIASVLSLYFSLYVRDESPGDTARAAHRLDAGLHVLRSISSVAEHSAQFGIDAVKPKSKYTSEEWMQVLIGAQQKLLLVGHALDTWCTEDFLSEFKATLIRLARDGGSVRLLTLPPEGTSTKNLGQLRGQDYGERVQTTLRHVAAVYAKLPSAKRDNLEVRVLAPEVPMPYMVVANEHVLITSAYPATGKSSGSMLATRMSSTSEAGRAIREDITHLLRNYATPVALDSSRPIRENEPT
jgi:hypothetical protein